MKNLKIFNSKFDEVIEGLNQLSTKMDRQVKSWSMQSDSKVTNQSLKSIKELLVEAEKQIELKEFSNISNQAFKQVFLNATSIQPRNFESLLLNVHENQEKYVGYFIKGWEPNQDHYEKLNKTLEKVNAENDGWAPPNWLKSWNNLNSSLGSILEIIKQNKLTIHNIGGVDGLPSSKIKRLLFIACIYFEELTADQLFEEIELIKAEVPIFNAIATNNVNFSIQPRLENVVAMAAVLKCRLNSVKLGKQSHKIEDFLNYVLLNNTVGDPRINTNSLFWREVRKLAEEPYQSWVSGLNIEDFKFFFRKEVMGDLDTDRVKFWNKYLKQMSRVQVIITTEKSRELKVRFKNDPEGMRTLSRAKIYRNAQFSSVIFYLYNQILIENHKTGAACYHYEITVFAKLLSKINGIENLNSHLDLMPRNRGGTRNTEDSWSHFKDAWDNPKATGNMSFYNRLRLYGIKEDVHTKFAHRS